MNKHKSSEQSSKITNEQAMGQGGFYTESQTTAHETHHLSKSYKPQHTKETNNGNKKKKQQSTTAKQSETKQQ